MSSSDRARWDRRYRERGPRYRAPEPFLVDLADRLPGSGRAVDLAAGAGRNAVWLAQQGLDTTAVDVSPVALSLAREAAAAAGVEVRTVQRDLEEAPPPVGPWDVVVVVRFLHRPLYRSIPSLLAPGGVAIVVQHTVRNLERHEHPSERYLLEEGELPDLLAGLDPIAWREGWTDEARHEAWLAARRPPRAVPLRRRE